MTIEAKEESRPRVIEKPIEKTAGNIFTNDFFVTGYAGIDNDSVFDPETRIYVPKEEMKRSAFSVWGEIRFRG